MSDARVGTERDRAAQRVAGGVTSGNPPEDVCVLQTPHIVISGGPFVYNQQAHAATCTVTGTDGQLLPGICRLTYDGSLSPPHNAGTYAVRAEFTSHDVNYMSLTAEGSLVIAPATPAIAIAAGPFTYNGLSRTATCSATGLIGPVPGHCTIEYQDGAPPVDAGSYTVHARPHRWSSWTWTAMACRISP